jgi:endoglucanase
MNLPCQLAGRLMRQPAAPCHELAVIGEVERICAEHGLSFEQDRFGNVLVRLRTAPARRPLVLAAHLDHPGFEILRPLPKRRWLARFCGGVGDAYFRPGIPVRLMPKSIPAILGARQRDKTFIIRERGEGDVERRAWSVKRGARGKSGAPSLLCAPRSDAPTLLGSSKQSGDGHVPFAVWDLEDFAIRAGRIYGRACDDLVGVACALAALIELKRSRARVHVIAALSRAEEIGFQGALTLAANRGLPRNSLVVSLETSRELPGVGMGEGVILRVGDRASIFDSEASRFLAEVAAGVKAGPKGRGQPARAFRFQRGLMGGGTCEATAYQEYGFQSAALCVALGNYHNCAERNLIRPEYVSVSDVNNMTMLLVAAARQMPRYPALIARLPKRLESLRRKGETRLRE